MVTGKEVYMEENEVYVYLFTGFLESGKTSLVQGTLQEPNFMGDDRGLLICCEEGVIEYDMDFLKSIHIDVVTVEEEEELTPAYLQELDEQYQPDRVFIEFNGMWSVDAFREIALPKDWLLVQILTTINAGTFQSYMNNMGGILVQHFRDADAVIINRCDEDTPMASYRRLIKANNPRAQIIYEKKDGSISNGLDEALPYDLQADIVEIAEEDYGIWYMDASEFPGKYKDKTFRFQAVVYHPEDFPPEWIVPGRFAMTCCVDDITFIGFKCHCKSGGEFKSRDWVDITVKAKMDYTPEYQPKGLVLEAVSIEKIQRSDNGLVYFT